jgi:hypothetical protein
MLLSLSNCTTEVAVVVAELLRFGLPKMAPHYRTATPGLP